MRKKVWVLGLLMLLLTACKADEEAQTEVRNVNEQLLNEWAGNIEIPQSHLPIILKLEKETGSLSVPAQGLHDFPFKSVAYNGNEVEITIDLQGSLISINGEWKEDKLEGTFKQNGQTFPMTLTVYEEEAAAGHELSVPVANGSLKVTLQKAVQDGSSPVAVILPGSGPTDQDGNTMGTGKNDSLKMLAEGLAKEGIATIRYDKRGIGKNAAFVSKEEELSFEQYVEDAVAVIQYLSSMDDFTSVHIIGHSEGSLVGMLASQKADVASFISLAGAGRPADELLLEQLEGQLTPALKAETEKILTALKNGQTVSDVPTELQSLFRPSVQPYMMSWLKYDPSKVIQDVTVPTLLIQGTNDLQITKADSEALKKGKKEAKLIYLDNMNHVLKEAPADREGNLATYTDASLPLQAELVSVISQFILE